MAQNISPEDNLGGFKIISDMLTGPQGPQGPQDMDDPIIDPKDINFDDDDNLGGTTDFDDPSDKTAIKDVKVQDPDDGDDPIIDPKDVDPGDDSIVDPKSKDEPTDEPVEDLSEYQEDIANYLKSELENNLGWKIPEDYEMKSMEDVVEFMGDLVSKASKPAYANEEVKAYDEFVKNGGNLRDFYSAIAEGRLNTEGLDLENEFNQKMILKEHLKNQGYNDSQIDRRLVRYDEAGVLEDEAADALEMVKEHNEKESKKLLDRQENEAERIKNEQLSFITNVEESVKGLETIRGIKVSEKDRSDLMDYILKTDSSGSTQYQRDYMANIDNLVESAYFTKNGQALIDKSKKKGQTEAYRSLHQKLKTNKGNTGKNNEGRDYGDSASSGLSLLGKQLLG